MCCIAGLIDIKASTIKTNIVHLSKMMNEIQHNREPDDNNIWIANNYPIGFAHKRLYLIITEIKA